MKKSELIEALTYYPTKKISHPMATQIVETFFDSIKEGLAKGNSIELRDWGIWKPRLMKARQGRNPRTAVKVDVKEKYKPFFMASNSLKRLINKGKNKK